MKLKDVLMGQEFTIPSHNNKTDVYMMVHIHPEIVQHQHGYFYIDVKTYCVFGGTIMDRENLGDLEVELVE